MIEPSIMISPIGETNPSPVVALVGNPNAGKTSLFNSLTGLNAKVGNYAGVTVERQSGYFSSGETEFECIDIPGLYSLNALSEDERIAKAAIMGELKDEPKPDLLVHVVDSNNLERNLFFLSQILELGRPTIVALTMTDLLTKSGSEVLIETLKAELGVDIFVVLPHKNRGISTLKLAIKRALEKPEDSVCKTSNEFAEMDAAERYGWAEKVRLNSIKENPLLKKKARTDKIDAVLTHKFWGLLVFLAIMYLMFQSIYTLASPIMDLISAGIKALGNSVRPPLSGTPWLESLIADGIIGGIGSVLVFLPQILILFGLIAALEGSGYLARASFLMDKLLGWCGLSGRAFIPLLSSFACAIPGIMAARVMPDSKSRLATILVAPLMSCSARLPVYLLLIGAVIEPKYGPVVAGMTLFGMHAVGAIIAIPIIFFLNRKVLKGTKLPFVLELPPYQVPKLRDIWSAVYGRGKVFLQSAGTMIFAMTVLIWALLYFPRSAEADQRYSQEYTQLLKENKLVSVSTGEPISQEHFVDSKRIENSILGTIGKGIEPVFRPAGFDWRISTAILAAFPAREVLVSSLGIIFELGGEQDGESADMRSAIRTTQNPDGTKLFDPTVSFGLMVFFALCSQCGSTLAIIKRETNSWKWPTFVFVYMTSLAWIAAVLIHQIGKLF